MRAQATREGVFFALGNVELPRLTLYFRLPAKRWIEPMKNLNELSRFRSAYAHSLCALATIYCFFGAGLIQAAEKKSRPAFDKVRSTVQRHFENLNAYKSGDIISKDEVRPVFQKLNKLGWKVKDEKKILEDTLDSSHVVVKTLRTRDGRRFMRKVSGERLIYDRLDRISHESGGQRLIRDLPKLPDASRYAKNKRPRAVPGLLDLLPKKRSGKTRRIDEYNKPTGRIYTEDDLIKRLKKSYDAAKATS